MQCVFVHLDIVQIPIDPLHPLSNRHLGALFFTLFYLFFDNAKMSKKFTNHPGKRSGPPKTRNCPFGCGNKVLQTIWASPFTPPLPTPPSLTGNVQYGNNTFQKGASPTNLTHHISYFTSGATDCKNIILRNKCENFQY